MLFDACLVTFLYPISTTINKIYCKVVASISKWIFEKSFLTDLSYFQGKICFNTQTVVSDKQTFAFTVSQPDWR